MNFLFLMDPLHTVIPEKDTTLALMLGAHRKGHTIYFLPDGGIVRKNNKLYFHVVNVTPQENPRQPFVEHHASVLDEEDVDIIFIRSDPPFDEQYLINTWLLDLLPKEIPVINRPSGIRRANEKIWAAQFTSITPKTFIGRNRQDIYEFLTQEKNIVAKPTDGHGGQSVFHIQQGDRNAHVILETLTKNWKRDVILQEFLAESQHGDKRILLLNGEPLGAVLRLHAEDDHRNNFFSGGKPLPCDITAQDKNIIESLAPELQRLGLYFAGIDIIGNYLVEVNVTSPTCLLEMNQLYSLRLEDDIIAFVEKLSSQGLKILPGCSS